MAVTVLTDRSPLQAIETRYLGPGNVRGGRVKAVAAAATLTLGWDDALNPEENHRAAAVALCAKIGWEGKLAHGVLESGHNVFVFVEA